MGRDDEEQAGDREQQSGHARPEHPPPERLQLRGEEPHSGDQDEQKRNLGKARARVRADGEDEAHGRDDVT